MSIAKPSAGVPDSRCSDPSPGPSTTTAASPASGSRPPKRDPLDVRSAFELLFDRAAGQLGRSDLSYLAEADIHADALALQCVELTSGLGCLVGDDDSAGSFRDQDQLASLLFLLSTQFTTIAGFTRLARRAREQLDDLTPRAAGQKGGAA